MTLNIAFAIAGVCALILLRRRQTQAANVAIKEQRQTR